VWAALQPRIHGAAAERWKVRADECRTEAGIVYGPSGQSAPYTELADDASRKSVPDEVVLKKPKGFRIIGKSTRRLDSRAKSNGSQKFGSIS
jgi:isoquinoline 1-oxidoreductase subunit beta